MLPVRLSTCPPFHLSPVHDPHTPQQPSKSPVTSPCSLSTPECLTPLLLSFSQRRHTCLPSLTFPSPLFRPTFPESEPRLPPTKPANPCLARTHAATPSTLPDSPKTSLLYRPSDPSYLFFSSTFKNSPLTSSPLRIAPPPRVPITINFLPFSLPIGNHSPFSSIVISCSYSSYFLFLSLLPSITSHLLEQVTSGK